MFELLDAKLLNKKEVKLSRPNEITILEDGEEKPVTYIIEKGASKFLYKQLDLKAGASEEVYKKNEKIWESLIDDILADTDERKAPFKLDDENVRYVADTNECLIDMAYMQNDYYDNLKAKLDLFKMEINSTEHTKKFYFEGTGGLVKLILYRADANIPENTYTPVVVLEANNKKSEYSVYTGILIYNNFTFIPSMNPVATFQSFIDFIMGVNILGTLSMAEESAEGLYNAYADFKSGHTEISARELIRILSKVGYKLNLKEDMSLDDIDKMRNEESNDRIKTFFNTFKLTTGETAEDILNLSEVKKVFKYNQLTIVDLLDILSKEYMSDDGARITAQVLSDLVFGLYTKKTDVVDAKGIIDDISSR